LLEAQMAGGEEVMSNAEMIDCDGHINPVVEVPLGLLEH